MSAIDITNKFLVALQGRDVVCLRPIPQRLSTPDALLLAAYLVAMAMPAAGEPTFEEVRAAVENG